MSKLSVLVFSRNNAGKVISLIKEVYDIADEIILIDSSDKKDRERLHKTKDDNRLNRLSIFYAVALGYPDPLRMWALKKCKYEWVLLLDTDERLTKELKSDINVIISNTKANAFAIRRYEEVRKDGAKTDFFTWQIRLFKKDKVLFKGILHEQPEVKGKLSKLNDRSYYIKHINELRTLTNYEYANIENFERLSYSDFNKRIIDYVSKLKMPESRTIYNSKLGRSINKLLILYEKATFKKPEQEISIFDYHNYYTLMESVYAIKKRDYGNVFKMLILGTWHEKLLKKWMTEQDSIEAFEISKIINGVGITKFLKLDDDKIIRTLNKKYKNQKQGINLLIKLLKEKYKSMQANTR